jgi:hypothetical protein
LRQTTNSTGVKIILFTAGVRIGNKDNNNNNYYYYYLYIILGPPLWSSGESSWLQIRRPGFDSRHYQIFWEKKKVVGPLSLVSTTEELLDRKVAAPV